MPTTEATQTLDRAALAEQASRLQQISHMPALQRAEVITRHYEGLTSLVRDLGDMIATYKVGAGDAHTLRVIQDITRQIQTKHLEDFGLVLDWPTS